MNQQFAQHYWPNQDPIGKRFRLVDPGKTWVQVIGLTKTSKYIFIGEPPTEYIYLARRQSKLQRMIMLVQSAGDPATLAGPMRQVVGTLDANMPIYNVRTMEELYRMRAIKIFNVIIATVGGLGAIGTEPLQRRIVRPRRIRGDPPNARDRHPHGDRCEQRRCVTDGAPAGCCARVDRPGAGTW